MLNENDKNMIKEVADDVGNYTSHFGIAGMTVRISLETLLRSHDRGVSVTLEDVLKVLTEIVEYARRASEMLKPP